MPDQVSYFERRDNAPWLAAWRRLPIADRRERKTRL